MSKQLYSFVNFSVNSKPTFTETSEPIAVVSFLMNFYHASYPNITYAYTKNHSANDATNAEKALFDYIFAMARVENGFARLFSALFELSKPLLRHNKMVFATTDKALDFIVDVLFNIDLYDSRDENIESILQRNYFDRKIALTTRN